MADACYLRWRGRNGQTILAALAGLTMEGFYRYARAPTAAGSARATGVGQ